jgi:hypothetical protein
LGRRGKEVNGMGKEDERWEEEKTLEGKER